MIPKSEPCSVAELVDVVRSTAQVIPVGAGTKARLSAVPGRFTPIALRRLQGIVEYEPDEYTITALAGTRVSDLTGVLRERGQYLPFDPLFVESGCTVGGTVAAGSNGPGSFRFGGVRDFILGVRFIDGDGRRLRMGGKVVKNAAGFDLPKFFVGSLGRFGLLAEVTFKVFPCPAATLTLRLRAETPELGIQIMSGLGRGRWQVDALDFPCSSGVLYVRLAGAEPALLSLAKDILGRWSGDLLAASDARAFWSGLVEARWAHSDGVLIKVPLTPSQLMGTISFAQALPGGRAHVSAGGNVVFVSLPWAADVQKLDEHLRSKGLTGLVLRGAAPLRLGRCASMEISRAIKFALDSAGRFPGMDEYA